MTKAQLAISPQETTPHAGWAAWLTTERVAYGSIALLALTARLIGLDWQPLGPAEAAQALPAWQAARGLDYQLAGASPLLFSLQRLAFFPFGGSDVLARWWPAFLGGLSPLLFYALRDRLGRTGALVAALLWALSPMAVFAARLGLGYGLVPTLALALLAALNLVLNCRSPRTPLIWAAVALGGLLASGPGAYTVLLAGIVAIPIWPATAATLKEQALPHRRTILVAALLSFVVSATFYLLAPSGLAAAADLLGAWLRGLRPGPGTYSPGDIVLRLVLSEPLVLIFGLGGLAAALRGRIPAPADADDAIGDRAFAERATDGHAGAGRWHSFALFLGLAAAIASVVSLFGAGRHPAGLALVVLPLAMLAGPAAADTVAWVWRWRDETDPWLLLGLSLALVASMAVAIAGYFGPATDESWRTLYLSIGIGAGVLMAAVWLVYGYFASWWTAGRVVRLLVLLAAGFWALGQLNGLNFENDPLRRSAVLDTTPGPGWVDLRAELSDLSALNGGGPREAPVDVVLPLGENPLAPMLRWELREYPAARFVNTPPAAPSPLVITPADESLAPGESYGGAGFVLLESWDPASLETVRGWVRWILYREARVAPSQTWEVVLWTDRGPVGAPSGAETPAGASDDALSEVPAEEK